MTLRRIVRKNDAEDRQQKQQEGKYRHEQRRGDLRRLQDLWREPLEEPEEPVVETPDTAPA
jgi:hypothetical protein